MGGYFRLGESSQSRPPVILAMNGSKISFLAFGELVVRQLTDFSNNAFAALILLIQDARTPMAVSSGGDDIMQSHES
ncbi:TPA: hypothetical protein DCX20_02170 [Patescibacteria group bacterium]|nr:hypothetical protein [Patescibacteria group bacterium]